MANISKYLEKQYLDWCMRDCQATVYIVPKPAPPPQADILEMKMGVVEAAVVGGAVVLGKNPKVSRRFWS